jgi:uncharacterized membrane protein YczE
MNHFKRIFIYCVGLFIMAVGVTFSVKSNLGVSPVNAIPYVVSLISGLDQGLCVSVIFCSYIILQVFILKRDFKLQNLLQIICASLFGYFVSFSNMLFYFEPSENYIIRLIYMLVSIVFIGVGVYLYLEARLIPLPAEGVMMALKEKTVFEFHNIKMGFDVATVILAVIISYIFLENISGVREGTIIAAILVGKVVGIISKFLKYKNFEVIGR